MQNLAALLTKDYLGKLESLSINIKTKIDSGIGGSRRSSNKGNSLEYSDFREYVSGDDIRRIDWNTYARFNKHFIKLFMEEKQASINIFIDSSKSMDYGKDNKGLYAKLIAASLTYISLKNSDVVNIYTLGETVSKYKVSVSNMFASAVDFLDAIKFDGEVDVNTTLKSIQNIGKGSCILISDYLLKHGFEKGVMALKYANQDISFIHVLCQEETSPNETGAMSFIDSETNETKQIIITPEILQQYQKSFSHYKASILEFCRKNNISYNFCSSNAPIFKTITQILKYSRLTLQYKTK